MDQDKYKIRIGEIVINLHGLEAMIRAVLCKINEDSEPHIEDEDIVEGAILPVTSYTNYKALPALIKELNKWCAKNDSKMIDLEVTIIRDRLAHGRIMSSTKAGTPRLDIFSDPKDGNTVTVLYAQRLDDELLGSWLNQIAKQMKIVHEIATELDISDGQLHLES